MINIGIVGLGGMGTVHYDNYQLINGCKVVAAVCHTDESRERAKSLKLTPYYTIEEMARHESIDCIDVCTPTYLHKQHVMEGLQQGMHVIVEKPIALNKRDAEEMYHLAAAKKRLLFVAQVVQFSKETEILRNFIKSEELGKPLDAYFQRIAGRPQWAKDGWLFDKEKSGLIPFDLHIHDLDLIVSLFGKPRNFSYTSCGGAESNYKESYRFQYVYDVINVAAEAAWYNANYPFRASWRVYFERGLLEYDGQNLILYQPDKEPFRYHLKEEKEVSTNINLPASAMFYHELSHFMKCIKVGEHSSYVPAKQVISVIEILEKVS